MGVVKIKQTIDWEVDVDVLKREYPDWWDLHEPGWTHMNESIVPLDEH